MYKVMETMLAYITRVRRKLHRCPEPAFCEFETQKAVESELAALHIPFREIGTGIVADLDLGKEKRIAFRADMDALPVTERTGAEYASERPGFMHACGHDGHMALLLGFAKSCAENPSGIGCNLRFVFQPAEEGEGGARNMIAGGALEGVDEIYAVHLDPSLDPGKLGLCYGASMAGDFEFDVNFTGESAHCAEKSKGKDALAAACEFAASLSELVGKGDSLLHAGKLTAGVARNVVAESAKLECTMRFFEEKERDRLLRLMKFQLGYLSDRYGVKGEIEKVTEYIPLKNARTCVDKLKAASDWVPQKRKYLGEDFAFYLAECKGAHGWLGVRKSPETKLHAADFDFEEQSLLAGLEIYRKLVEND